MSEDLAARQAALLRALLADGDPPPGFDAARLRVETVVLRRKWGRLVAYLRPDVARHLGEQFGPRFEEFAVGRPKRTDERATGYAGEFAAWLTARGELPEPKRGVLTRLRGRFREGA